VVVIVDTHATTAANEKDRLETGCLDANSAHPASSSPIWAVPKGATWLLNRGQRRPPYACSSAWRFSSFSQGEPFCPYRAWAGSRGSL